MRDDDVSLLLSFYSAHTNRLVDWMYLKKDKKTGVAVYIYTDEKCSCRASFPIF